MSTVTFQGTPIQLQGHFLKTGQVAPDFHLMDQNLKEKTLHDFPRQKKLLLTVPSLDTPVCSLSTKKFSQALQTKKNITILVVSADLPFAQKRVCGAEALQVTSLSMMKDKSFAKDYGVLIQEGPLAGLCARSVLLLDEDNIVLYGELVKEITLEPNYEQVLALL